MSDADVVAPAGSSRVRSRRSRVRRVLVGMVAVVLVLMVGVKLVDVTAERRERQDHPAPGELVEVDGHRMHVRVSGEGPLTMVLLPGLGTAAPVYDFRPLVSELDPWAKVAVVEPFGYGWSDETSSSMLPRDVARQVERALDGAGLDGPFVLVAHSLGGVYAQAFVDEYPDLVSGFVGLDPTMARTGEFLPDAERSVDPYADPFPTTFEVLVRGGWVRPVQAVVGQDPQMFTGAGGEDGYSDANLRMQEMISNWSWGSANMRAQGASLAEATAQTRELRFDEDVPAIVFTADAEGERPAWRDAVAEDYLEGSSCSQDVPVVSGHYVHHERAADVAEEVRRFLERCDVR